MDMRDAQWVCILGTHHAYQFQTIRKQYSRKVAELIRTHAVDVVAEEATGIPGESYAAKVARENHTQWENVDLTVEEKRLTPDTNPYGSGSEVDFELLSFREWVWVIRTSKAMKKSALLICGLCHTISVASKFSSLGFNVEVHVYFDWADQRLFTERVEAN